MGIFFIITILLLFELLRIFEKSFWNWDGWSRPAGPLKIWKTVNGYRTNKNGKIKPVTLSIQEIPRDRFDEAVRFLCEIFVHEDACFNYLGIRYDRIAIMDMQSIIMAYLNQGISVAAYRLDSCGNINELAGLNVLHVSMQYPTLDTKEVVSKFKSKRFVRYCRITARVGAIVNPHKSYDVDKILAGRGLCVHPFYRRQNLGCELLKIREKIGKEYGINVSANWFNSEGRKVAARVGYKELFSYNMNELLNKRGKPFYPNLDEVTSMMAYDFRQLNNFDQVY